MYGSRWFTLTSGCCDWSCRRSARHAFLVCALFQRRLTLVGRTSRIKMKMLLSCISTQHSILKQHWEKNRDEIACPVTVLGSFQKPDGGKTGLVCLLDETGKPQ